MFQGFTPESVQFLWGIRFNNERSWFEAHKQDYLLHIQQPLRQLAVQVQEQVLQRHPERQLNVHVSRIYRDARRLHGRGPYKDHMWLVLRTPGRDSRSAGPDFYFEIAPERYSIGMGYYSATPLTMAKLRARIARDPKPMETLARAIARNSNFHLEGEEYRRPKGSKGALLDPWYNRKSIAVSWDRPCEGSLFTAALVEEIADSVDLLLPLFDYLSTLDADPEPAKM